MNTRQLRYLVTVAAFGSLSRAAQALGVSQPALSKSLGEWEAAYGFSLFLRWRKQLTPTAVGRFVIDTAQKILDEQTRMMLTMRAVTGNDRQTVRVCTAPNRGAIIYSYIYGPFSRQYPDVSLRLTELFAKDQPAAIARGEVDLAIGAGPMAREVEDLPFAREELLVSLPASHPLAGRGSVSLRELRDTPFALQGKDHSIRAIADRLFAQAGFQPVVTFESGDVILLDSMLRQGVGAGLVSKVHVLPNENASYIPLDPPVYQLMHIRWPKGHQLTDQESCLAGLLIRQRLSDSRYEPIHSPQADRLYALAGEMQQAAAPASPRGLAPGSSAQVQPSGGAVSFDTKVLEYLIAIVEEQSLSAAADRFYLAQPALSRHLRNVEEMVGLPLFARDHNRLRPTNAGMVFVNSARNILLYGSEMENHIKAYRQGHGGRLFLHCDPMLTPLFRERVEGAFAARYPQVVLEVVESSDRDSQEALLNASADLGLFFTCEPKRPPLRHEVLGLTELVYCADAEAPLPGLREGDSLPGLLPRRKVMLAPQGTTLRREQDLLAEKLYEEPPQVVCQAQFPLLQKLAALGGADGVLPLHLLPRTQWGRCCALRPPRPYYLILAHNPSRHLPDWTQDLMDLIRWAFSDWPENSSFN